MGCPGRCFGVGVSGSVDQGGLFDGDGAWWAVWVGVGEFFVLDAYASFWMHMVR